MNNKNFKMKRELKILGQNSIVSFELILESQEARKGKTIEEKKRLLLDWNATKSFIDDFIEA